VVSLAVVEDCVIQSATDSNHTAYDWGYRQTRRGRYRAEADRPERNLAGPVTSGQTRLRYPRNTSALDRFGHTTVCVCPKRVASCCVRMTCLETLQELATKQHAADGQKDQEPMADQRHRGGNKLECGVCIVHRHCGRKR
jgi:hypothetical protein